MKHKILKLTKEQKNLADRMMFDALVGKEIEITNAFEHQVAEQLIVAECAEIIEKKNYGRIAKIKGIKL